MFEKPLATQNGRHRSRQQARTRRPLLEHLEDRVTPAPFTAGDLVLVRVGDGTQSLNSSATATFLDEYTANGVLTGNSIALPTDPGNSLTLSGTGTTEGFISGSADGHSLTIAGYNAVPGSVTFDNTNPVNRVIGVIYPDGSIDTSTQFPQSDASTVRSAASVDGQGFWVATSNFLRYIPFGGSSSTALSALVSSPSVAEIFPATGLSQTSELYIDGGAGAQPNGFPPIDSPATVGNGLPINGGQNVTVPAEFPTASTNGAFPTSNQFVISPDGNTVWIADGRTNGDGGLLTYHRTNSFGLYQRVPGRSVNFTNFGLRGLAAQFNGNTTTLYGTTTQGSANQLYRFVDNGSGTSSTLLATAAANEVLRGVALAPIVAGTTTPNVSLTIDTSSGTTYGAEPTLRATVPGSATGYVTFQLVNADQSLTEIGAAPVVNGTATLRTDTNLPAGADTVEAVYTGNSTFASQASAPQTVTIAPASTSGAVSFSVNPIGTGSRDTISATITASTAQANGFGVAPTGTVTFYVTNKHGQLRQLHKAVPLTQSVINLGGNPTQVYQASLGKAFHNLGNYQITAIYSGDGNYNPSTSPSRTLNVVYSTVATVTTSDPNPLGSSNEQVTLTATVTSAGGTPTGTVDFYDDLIRIGTATLDGNGAASVTVTTNRVQAPSGQADQLTPGLHSITAIFTPDHSDTFFKSQGVYEQAVQADPFTPGDLFIFRVGDGTTPIINVARGGSVGNTIFVDEYTPGQSTPVQSIILPTADGMLTNQYDQRMIHAVVADGQQSATGQLALSLDGQYLFLSGYDSNPLAAATPPLLHTVNTTSRAVARIGPDGTVETIGFVAGAITGFNSPGVQTGGNIDGVFSPDGNQFYVSGGNGVDYFANFAPTPELQSFTSRITLSAFTVVGLESDGSNLYAAGGATPNPIVGQVGTGFPTTQAPITTLPGFPGTSNISFPVDVYFTHLDGPGAPDGINTMYVADDGPGFSRGTVTKWSFDGTNWNLSGTITADGTTVISFYWLAGQTNGNVVNLYVTYGQGGNGNTGRGDLYQLTDSAGYGQPFSSTVVATIATVDNMSLENFRGVAFAPQAISMIRESHTAPIGSFGIPGARAGVVTGSPNELGSTERDKAKLMAGTTGADADVRLDTAAALDAYHQMAVDSGPFGSTDGLMAGLGSDPLS